MWDKSLSLGFREFAVNDVITGPLVVLFPPFLVTTPFLLPLLDVAVLVVEGVVIVVVEEAVEEDDGDDTVDPAAPPTDL